MQELQLWCFSPLSSSLWGRFHSEKETWSMPMFPWNLLERHSWEAPRAVRHNCFLFQNHTSSGLPVRGFPLASQVGLGKSTFSSRKMILEQMSPLHVNYLLPQKPWGEPDPPATLGSAARNFPQYPARDQWQISTSAVTSPAGCGWGSVAEYLHSNEAIKNTFHFQRSRLPLPHTSCRGSLLHLCLLRFWSREDLI